MLDLLKSQVKTAITPRQISRVEMNGNRTRLRVTAQLLRVSDCKLRQNMIPNTHESLDMTEAEVSRRCFVFQSTKRAKLEEHTGEP